MEQTFPTFLELKQFIKENPETSICQIRDKFNQRGDAIISMTKDKCKKKQLILAYSINENFFEYLEDFMKEEYVICDTNMLSCRIYDKTRYVGKEEFLPLVLSIIGF